MAEIEVDPALLAATGRRLRAAVEVAREVRSERSTLTAMVADAGHDELAESVRTFLDRWAHGIGCLVDDAETLARMLSDAGTAYGRVEAATAAACETGG